MQVTPRETSRLISISEFARKVVGVEAISCKVGKKPRSARVFTMPFFEVGP